MLELELLDAADPQRLVVEEVLRARGIPVPVDHSVRWLAGRCGSPLLAVFRSAGQVVGAAPVCVIRPRSMPGHQRLFAEKFGASVATEHVGQATAALIRKAESLPHVLDITIESYSRDPAFHLGVTATAAQFGYAECAITRAYSRTVVVDLAMPEQALFATLHHSVRRAIRNIHRDGHAVRLIEPRYAARVDSLYRETMDRSHGPYRRFDWARILEFSLSNPSASRVSGLFIGNGAADEDLVGIAWSFGEGARQRYHVGASTRRAGIPILHAVIWDHLTWGQANGGTWFDFAGVPARAQRIGDSLDSIADFKRKFSHAEEMIGHSVSRVLRPMRFALSTLTGRARSALTHTPAMWIAIAPAFDSSVDCF